MKRDARLVLVMENCYTIPVENQSSSEADLTNIPLDSFPEREDVSVERSQQQLERVLESNTLRNSFRLQQLLQFLAARVIEGNVDGLKEYTVGVEAFGRKPDFDPKTDTIVRVQTHRLRQKLREYYEQEGIHDHVLIEIPKGHYYPAFRHRTDSLEPAENDGDGDPDSAPSMEANSAHANSSVTHEAVAARAGNPFLRHISGPTVAVSALILTLTIGYVAGNLQAHNATTGNGGTPSSTPFDHRSTDPVNVFWSALLASDPAPIIAYPNAIFLLDNSNDLFFFRQGASDNRGARVDSHLAREFASNPTLAASAGPLYYEDGYTGTGELEGVSMLSMLFTRMGLTPTIKTSRNITPEDLQQHTVVLLGSPFQNVAVSQLMAAGDFRFDNPDSRRTAWQAVIVNARPGINESPVYHTERDPETEVLKRDYGLISIQPGVVAAHDIVFLGGLDTKGTEGAIRFVTSRSGVQELLAALAAKGLKVTGTASEMPWFQALVRVQLEKGDQVLSTEVVTVHPLTPNDPPVPNTEPSSPHPTLSRDNRKGSSIPTR